MQTKMPGNCWNSTVVFKARAFLDNTQALPLGTETLDFHLAFTSLSLTDIKLTFTDGTQIVKK